MPRRNVKELSPRTNGAERILDEHARVDLLDLSRLSSEYGRQIHPCKVDLDIDLQEEVRLTALTLIKALKARHSTPTVSPATAKIRMPRQK